MNEELVQVEAADAFDDVLLDPEQPKPSAIDEPVLSWRRVEGQTGGKVELAMLSSQAGAGSDSERTVYAPLATNADGKRYMPWHKSVQTKALSAEVQAQLARDLQASDPATYDRYVSMRAKYQMDAEARAEQPDQDLAVEVHERLPEDEEEVIEETGKRATEEAFEEAGLEVPDDEEEQEIALLDEPALIERARVMVNSIQHRTQELMKHRGYDERAKPQSMLNEQREALEKVLAVAEDRSRPRERAVQEMEMVVRQLEADVMNAPDTFRPRDVAEIREDQIGPRPERTDAVIALDVQLGQIEEALLGAQHADRDLRRITNTLIGFMRDEVIRTARAGQPFGHLLHDAMRQYVADMLVKDDALKLAAMNVLRAG